MGKEILTKTKEHAKISKSSFEGYGILVITDENLIPGSFVDYELKVKTHDADKLVQVTKK
jgi:hypothetical protein